jgi:hypothetical protein
MEVVKRFLNSLPDAYQQLVKSVFDDMGEEGAENLMKKLTKRVSDLGDKIENRRKRATNFEAQIRDTDFILERLDAFKENGNAKDLGLLLVGELLRDRAERLRHLIEKVEVDTLVQKKRELEDTMSRLRNRMRIAEGLNLLLPMSKG